MSDNLTIAKNTLFLYAKLIINIVTSFIISRLVLDALGASDFGLYNVVGGIVAMLNTLGTSMVSTSYRYISVEMGKGGTGDVNKVYNTVLVIHLFLAILLLLVGESIGVYYVNNFLNVDASKIPDALFVLHLSLLTTAFVVITIPMNGLLIAREKFLFISLVESTICLLKLLLIIILLYVSGNRLRLYAVFLAVCQGIIPLCYQYYCRRYNKEIVKWNFNRCKNDYKRVLSFAWWIFLGALANIGRIHGANIVINKFFGTVINAAFGLATQAYHAVSYFTSTMVQAVVPQIMKNQSSGNTERSINLVYLVARFSFLMMLTVALPLFFCINSLLKVWLGNPPEFTSIFVVFLLINGLISNLGAGFDASIQSTGSIKKNQIGYSIINLSLLPLIYFLYKLGFPPYVNVLVMIILTFVTLFFQMGIMIQLTNFDKNRYFKVTLLPAIRTVVISVITIGLLHLFFDDDIISSLIYYCLSLIVGSIIVLFSGLDKKERIQVYSFIKKKK